MATGQKVLACLRTENASQPHDVAALVARIVGCNQSINLQPSKNMRTIRRCERFERGAENQLVKARNCLVDSGRAVLARATRPERRCELPGKPRGMLFLRANAAAQHVNTAAAHAGMQTSFLVTHQ